MIVDCRKEDVKFDVVDRSTGLKVDHTRIFYADDDVGLYVYHESDAEGNPVVRDSEFVAHEIQRPNIKIELRQNITK